MKKVILMVLVFASFQTFGQGFFDKLHFELKAGADYSNFIDTEFKTEGLIGLHVGAIVIFDISDRFTIQKDILFSTQGITVKKMICLKKIYNFLV